MSHDDTQSLRDFVTSLGDTAVDLEPIGAQARGENEESTDNKKKKRIIIIASLAVLVIAVAIAVAAWLSHKGGLSEDYEKARAEYEQVREEALESLADAEMLAEDCRIVIDNAGDCTALDAAISDVEEKSLEIPVTSPSTEAIEELNKATEDLRQSLAELDTVCTRVEDEMGDSIGLNLQELITEGKQVSASASALLRQYQGALETETDGDELKRLLERLDSTIETAQSFLEDDVTGKLAPSIKPSEARDVAKSLRQLIDDVTEESGALSNSHQAYLNNQAKEENNRNNENVAPNPSSSESAEPSTNPSDDSEEGNSESGDNPTTPPSAAP